jgi:hypothetical protein
MIHLISQEVRKGYTSEQARQDRLVLTALELVPSDLDLYQVINALLEEQAAGLYDPDDETLYVANLLEGDGLGPLEKSVFVHEYTHALQDQYFDLEALGMGGQETSWDEDQLQAIQSLVEGDATFTMQQYMTTHLKPLEILQLIWEAVGVDQEALDRAPAYLRESLLFPYQDGLLFVQNLYQRGGWSTVDLAYSNLPQSTEQIMHPERYPHDMPQVVTLPPLGDTLDSDWQLVSESVLGEFNLRAYLDIHLPRSQAEKAADGWGGDQYAVYQNVISEQVFLALLLAWDSEAEATEFVTIYWEYAQDRFGDDPDQAEGDAHARWIGAHDVLLLASSIAPGQPTRTLIVLAPDEGLAERAVQEFPGF